MQGIAYLRGGPAEIMQGVPVAYQIHILLGFTILLVSPFTRLVHVWSRLGTLAYTVRPYQLVRRPGASAGFPRQSRGSVN